MNRVHAFGFLIGACLISSAWAQRSFDPKFIPCVPESEYIADSLNSSNSENSNESLPDLGFCAQWNPEYPFNGHHCCGFGKRKFGRFPARVGRASCGAPRRKANHCDEMTEEQKNYIEKAESGQLGDLLSLITSEMGKHGDQAQCAVNAGFLAWGRPLIPNEKNRIRIRVPEHCTQFGTDNMIAMLEWAGRKVGEQYSSLEFQKTHLLVGDIAAPRGGCLSGRGGRRGHSSHTTGQDVDIGFLSPLMDQDSPAHFSKKFDPKANWWLFKQLFNNPYACVKVIFLDRKKIRELAKVASNDEDWGMLHRYIRHVRGHQNHFHVRVGDSPGQPGCSAGDNPDLEPEEMAESNLSGSSDERVSFSKSGSISGENTEIDE